MKRIYITEYSVKGIKNLDEWAVLSFYKKTIRKPLDFSKYNVKAIYGINGAGKSGIIRSVDILKKLICDPDYLNNRYIQKQLNDLINKKTKTLEIKTEFLQQTETGLTLYHYEIKLEKNYSDKYVITSEKLSCRNALSNSSPLKDLYTAGQGILYVYELNHFGEKLIESSKNLLLNASLTAVFTSNPELIRSGDRNDDLWTGLASTILFASDLSVYMEQSDNHSAYYMSEYLDHISELTPAFLSSLSGQMEQLSSRSPKALTPEEIHVKKEIFNDFEKKVHQLSEFIRIFKNNLVSIDIERKEDIDCYVCSLIMVYEDYSVNAEFESTGVKKLIRLFDYMDQMVQGKTVFIDELDSNIHDVYLCALLEYLMENAEGQLCFTTHNIGPMDILRRNKKSIDFLSSDHKIYSWKTNGNYSPASLYRNGMIEGSPFNIFSFDFMCAFHSSEDDQ